MIARPQLERALQHAGGTHTMEDVERAIAAGEMQLWEGVESAVVTEIHTAPRAKILHIFLAGGRATELEAMWPAIAGWGRTQGCDRATLAGRAGWARSFLTKYNWRPTAVLMGVSL